MLCYDYSEQVLVSMCVTKHGAVIRHGGGQEYSSEQSHQDEAGTGSGTGSRLCLLHPSKTT